MLIDFVIKHANADQRPYIEVTVLGQRVLGLLDSGATCTLVGRSGWEFLKRLGLELDTSTKTACTVANGQQCRSVGRVHVPFELMGKLCVLEVLVMPDLSHHLLLGTDFWIAMGIVPDLRSDVWHFSGCNPCDVAAVTDATVLSPDQRLLLEQIIEKKFREMGDGLGYTTLAEHDIITESTPIKQRYYPVSPHRQKILDEELKKMLEQDIVEPSVSGWSSPVLLVPKKDGGYRFCVDYRKLNSVTKRDAYPLPYVNAILDRLRDAKYLSSLDIKSAYWQVPVRKSSRELTAFTVPGRGLFQFKRMPFGLMNAPMTWQRLIDRVLGADLEPFVFVYLDDIIVVSPNFEIHISLLEKVLDRLTAAGLTVSRDKCHFCRPQLRYLGYVVDGAGLRVDPEKVEAILNIKTPTNVSELRRFVGMASWYRRFVPDFSSVIAPLTNLTKKNVSFIWSQGCDTAFRRIKELLVTAPILNCPDFSREFILQTDASDYGLGAVLSQNCDGDEKVIAFLSRSLSRQERNYTTTEKELLAVIWSVEKLRHYLEGSRFTVITDHYSLLWLNRLKDPTGRLARWAVRLQAFDFNIIHRKGKEHVVPDFLSRSVPREHEKHEESVCAVSEDVVVRDGWYERMLARVRDFPERYPQFRVEEDRLFKYVKCSLPELSGDPWKLVVPKNRRGEVLYRCHDAETSGHMGVAKTFWRIRDRYYWPKMRADITHYVKRCRTCAAQKPERKLPAGHMGSRPSVTCPWQMISLDFIGPLPRSTSGYRFLLVICDFFSKFVLLFPTRNCTSKVLASKVEEEVFLMHGVPQYLVCDNGSAMRGREFVNVCKKYASKVLYTPLYYPRADPAERTNQVVKTMIRSYLRDNHTKWDTFISAIGCAIRTATHETIGYSPYFVNFGRSYIGRGMDHDVRVPAEDDTHLDMDLDGEVERRARGFRELFNKIDARIKAARERSRHQYNLRRRHVEFAPGQPVWRRNKVLSDACAKFSGKLAPRFVGPYKVRKKLGYCTYLLEDDNGTEQGVWHVQDLKAA